MPVIRHPTQAGTPIKHLHRMAAQPITVIFHREAVASAARGLAVRMSRPLVGVTTLRFASMERAGRHRSTANRSIAFPSIQPATRRSPGWTH